MTTSKHQRGIVTVQATTDIQVQYDSDLGTLELIRGDRVIRSEYTPRNYSARQFCETVRRVRAYYSTN